MSPSTMREPSPLQASDFFYPRGIECVFEYNGLIFNDRRVREQIRITKITGLDDPDVRDARELNSDRDGETPFDSLYGGRTITLTGYIKADSLNRLRQLFAQLKDAFDVLEESPLYMRWLGWNENWSASNALVDYTFDTGPGTLVPSNGELVPLDATTKRLRFTPKDYSYEDAQVTLKMTTGSAISALAVETFVRADVNGAWTYLCASLDANSLDVAKRTAGTFGLLATTPFTPTVTTDYWVRFRAEEARAIAEIFSADPWSGAEPVAVAGPYTLSAAEQTAFASGHMGFTTFVDNTAERYHGLTMEPMNPGDLMINCRKVGKIDSEESQTGYQYRRDFMITLRASDPRFVSTVQSTVEQVPTTFALAFPSSGGLLVTADGFTFGTPLGTVNNLGRSFASPIIRMQGQMVNPALMNNVNEKRIAINGTIADGDYIDIDIHERTVQDSNGNNVYSMLTDDSEWPEIEPGTNDLVLGADSGNANARVFVYYRHSYR